MYNLTPHTPVTAGVVAAASGAGEGEAGSTHPRPARTSSACV